MKNNKVLGIFFSDPHFSLNPPPLRSTEPDWFAAMKKPFDEIALIQKANNCPLFCCGDVYDRWNSPPELINWIADNIPVFYSIPGQHDLPEHDHKQLDRSAYLTSIATHNIKNLAAEHRSKFNVYGFPFGIACKPLKNPPKGINIAILHQYNWIEKAKHGGELSESSRVSIKRYKEFDGYDYVFCGDNHVPFRTYVKDTQFINCGGLMRRTSRNMKWHPSIYLLYHDRVQRYRLDMSQDKYLDVEEAAQLEQSKYNDLDISTMIKSLGKLNQDILDVKETFERAFENASAERRRILQEAMGNV